MLQEIQLMNGQNNCVVMTSDFLNKPIEKRLTTPIRNNENYLSQSQSELMRRKKVNYKTNPYIGPQAASIARRNARERNRVKQVNDGFAALRKHLPASVVAALSNGARRGTSKKLSKVDTLRMVVEYIRYLQQLLEDNESGNSLQNDCTDFNARLENTLMSSVYDLAPSPSPSDSSSGVSSGYYQLEPQEMSPMHEDELLDVISWWQQK